MGPIAVCYDENGLDLKKTDTWNRERERDRTTSGESTSSQHDPQPQS